MLYFTIVTTGMFAMFIIGIKLVIQARKRLVPDDE